MHYLVLTTRPMDARKHRYRILLAASEPVAYRLVCLFVCGFVYKFEVKYLGNQSSSGVSYYGGPTGWWPGAIEWWRRRWRHVTLWRHSRDVTPFKMLLLRQFLSELGHILTQSSTAYCVQNFHTDSRPRYRVIRGESSRKNFQSSISSTLSEIRAWSLLMT